MSQENVSGRGDSKPIRSAERRTWEDHIAVRFPRLYRRSGTLLWRVLTRLPVGHPIRRAVFERVIGRSYGAFNRSDLNAVRALYHPECVWDWSSFEGWPDDPIAHGPEALRRGFLVFRDAWGDFRVDASDLRDFGDSVMLTCHLRATGSGSGVGITRTWWQAGYIRDGLIARVENYTDRERALEAVGLSEQDATHADS
jgi:ketosteroid isomerase-like protein